MSLGVAEQRDGKPTTRLMLVTMLIHEVIYPLNRVSEQDSRAVLTSTGSLKECGMKLGVSPETSHWVFKGRNLI